MGSPEEDKEAEDDEKPQHSVRITRPFYLGACEVTQGQYEAVMGANPSFFSSTILGDLSGYKSMTGRLRIAPNGSAHPVEQVFWLDAVKFCNTLSVKEGRGPFYKIEGDNIGVPDWNESGYRLPTEAEWEYACRAGTKTRYSFGDGAGSLAEYAWYEGSSQSRTHPVGKKQPNPFGLFDMHGNVWEWCWDGYDANRYTRPATHDPRGADGVRPHVNRGGGWRSNPRIARSANRDRNDAGFRSDNLGFRLARSHSAP
jgi:formylglycine-generating enzyme required for sulfatase activity